LLGVGWWWFVLYANTHHPTPVTYLGCKVTKKSAYSIVFPEIIIELTYWQIKVTSLTE
jgi:hypothetical protein